MAGKASRMVQPSFKASYIVKPAEQTPNEMIFLTACDQIAAITHAPGVYFYGPTGMSLKDATQTLKDSLSKALVIFYPVAGRLRMANGGRVELHCNSEGVLLVEAESEAILADYGDFIPTTDVRALIPSVDYTTTPINEMPLILVQITKFSCGGISFGMALSHSIADGQNAFQFMHEWPKIARGERSVVDPPIFDRSIMKSLEASAMPSFHHPEFDPVPLLLGQTDNLEERKKPTTVAMLKIMKEQIEKLKNEANKDKAQDNTRGYSRFEVLGGHIWRCACKARGLDNKQPTRLDVGASIRNRVNPAKPERYFGNAVVRIAATAMVSELLSNSLSFVASTIRQTTESLTDEYIRSYLAFIKNAPDVSRYRNFHSVGCALGAFYGNPNMESTSWIGVPIYGLDFGWGEDIFMVPGTVAFDGKFFIVPARHGDGSFNVILRMQVEHMDAFKKFFFEDL